MTRRALLRALLWAGAAVTSVAAGLQVPGMTTQEWEARAAARLVADSPGVTAYDEDALGREGVLLTFAVLTADRAFVRQAARQRGLSEEELRAFRVTVGNAPRSALITVTVRGPDQAAVAALATGVRAAVVSWVAANAPLYRLRPNATTRAEQVTAPVPMRRERLVGLAALAVALVVAATRVRHPRAGAPPRSSGAGS